MNKDVWRIVVTSDLHCGQSFNLERDIAEARKLARHGIGADLFVLAGDIGETSTRRGLETVERTLHAFASDLACPSAVIGGNHDIAVNRTAAEDSAEIYFSLFDQSAARFKFHNLEQQNYVLGEYAPKIAVVGTLGPITRHLKVPGPGDYSRAYHRFKRGTIQDFEDRLFSNFSQRLAAAQNDETVEQLIVICHVPPALPKQSSSRFMGAISQSRKVSLVVFGDTHKSFPAHRLDGIPLVPTLSDLDRYASIVVDVRPFERPRLKRWWIEQDEPVDI